MVSYYTPMPYAQKHSAANLAYSGQAWNWASNYHTPPNPQFLSDMEPSHAHHQVYYNAHMFHTPAAAGGTPSEWHSPTSSAENYSQNTAASAHQMLQQHHVNNLVAGSNGNVAGSSASSGSSSTSSGPPSGNTQLNETASSINDQHIAEGLPSPPITVSGSEISSPGAPNSSSSPHHIAHHLNNNNNNNSPSTNNNNNNNNNQAHHNNNNRTSPVKPQYYEWMKKPSYPAQPAPGKTRTKDKYRVVYTDFQRLELEKEYCTSRYITIRRKTELAQSLSLSERQVKIWFQNRRAKERKQNKKGSDSSVMSSVQHNDYMIETKPKLDSGLHLQNPLHSLNSMAMGMAPMRLHHHHHPSLSHSLAMSVAAAHSHHQLHQPSHAQMSAAAAAGVGSLSM